MICYSYTAPYNFCIACMVLKYKLCVKSSKTEGIKMCMVYLHFDAKDLLWKASSFIGTPLPACVEVFEAVLESTSWNASELFCCAYLNGLNVIISMPFQYLLWLWE